MRLTLSLMALLSLLFVATLTNIFHVTVPQFGTAVISQKGGKAIGGNNDAVLLPSELTAKQLKLLNFAYATSAADGNKKPEILQGILLQESKAGELKSYKVAGQEFGLKPNERYYGPCQIKLAAAKDVLAVYPALRTKYDFQTTTDEEIIAHLIMSDEFNIEVASKYLKILSDSYGLHNIETISAAYNQGPGGQREGKGKGYAQSVIKHLQALKSKL
jgi:hypothetical protein